MERVVTQVLPWLTEAYGAASDSRQVAFGGSSFGGICTLWACMHHGDKFDAALVESPSLWFGEEKFFRCVGWLEGVGCLAVWCCVVLRLGGAGFSRWWCEDSVVELQGCCALGEDKF
jgi:S-formylglutathione hydrolase FrmB